MHDAAVVHQLQGDLWIMVRVNTKVNTKVKVKAKVKVSIRKNVSSQGWGSC